MSSSDTPELFGSKDWGLDLYRLTDLTKPDSDDRSVAIIYVSYLEKYLGEVLKKELPGLGSDLRASLFEPEGLLGPFMARAHIARGLKLLSPEGHADYKTLASIRNQFAHRIPVNSFDHPEISSRVLRLRHRPKMTGATREFFKRLSERVGHTYTEPAERPIEHYSNRDRFLSACTGYIMRMYFRLETEHPFALAPSDGK